MIAQIDFLKSCPSKTVSNKDYPVRCTNKSSGGIPAFFIFKFYAIMKKEELFRDDFLREFKIGDELNGFPKGLQKRGIEKML